MKGNRGTSTEENTRSISVQNEEPMEWMNFQKEDKSNELMNCDAFENISNDVIVDNFEYAMKYRVD